MTERTVEPREPRPAVGVAMPAKALVPLYAGTLFLSACLLFSVQPMFAKMVLPLLGGSPGVWNTAMVFFQASLLAGYAYAHISTRLLGIRRQAVLHLAVLAVAAIVLPIGIGDSWMQPPAEGEPVFWLLGLLAVAVGLPFFAVSATAPLLQKWFSHTAHESAGDPYFLYAASNLGSILALLSYPVVIEPLLRLGQQSLAWAWGYAALAAAIAVCAYAVWRPRGGAASESSDPVGSTISAGVPDWRRRCHWLALAFAPSSLLLGVTTHITTDIAAVPLLWVVPLALYLLTFVLVFARRPPLGHMLMVRVQALLILPLILLIWFPAPVWWIEFIPHILVFFVTAMVCHGELVRLRPPVSHLTEFYFWLSAGGVLGGIFNALVAPFVFSSVLEYPLVLAIACLLRPSLDARGPAVGRRDLVFSLIVLAVVVLWLASGQPALAGRALEAEGRIAAVVFLAVMILVVFSARARPIRFGLSIGALLLPVYFFEKTGDVLTRERSFFGVNIIGSARNGEVNFLLHGTTVHGAQYTDPERRTDPLTYHTREGPFGQVFAALDRAGRPPHRVGVLGLGIGALACYRQPGQEWVFYEIDPVVERIARDTRHFHYMSDCAEESPVVLGDGRLMLAREAERSFDLLIFDAFSSDSVPVHLLTREALAVYLDKLAEGGLLVFNASNRYLDVIGILAATAADAGLVAVMQLFVPDDPQESVARFRFPVEAVVMARDRRDLEVLIETGKWTLLEAPPGATPWTDHFSNLIGALR